MSNYKEWKVIEPLVLEWVLREFRPDREYTSKDVSLCPNFRFYCDKYRLDMAGQMIRYWVENLENFTRIDRNHFIFHDVAKAKAA